MFKKILFLPLALFAVAVLAQTAESPKTLPSPEFPEITPATDKCFQKFVNLRADSLKNLKEMFRMQDEMEAKSQIQKALPAWQIKQIQLQREHSLKSMEILQEIKQNELDEKTCQSLIERLELADEMSKLSKELFELMPNEDSPIK